MSPSRFAERSGALGVSPGLPLRTLAAGHPGPRSLGCPLRFGPPGVACAHPPGGQPRAHPSLTVFRTACSPLRGDLRPGGSGMGRVSKRDGSSGAAVGLNGTGLRVPEAPRQSRGRFAARGPVPLAGVFALRHEDPSRLRVYSLRGPRTRPVPCLMRQKSGGSAGR